MIKFKVSFFKTRISGTPDLMKSSTESSVTSNQSDEIKTVISNTMASSIDDIDLDDELIVIETEENSSVPEVKLQSGGHTTIMTGMKYS